MNKLVTICVVFVLLLMTSSAFANTTVSSTMWFRGELDLGVNGYIGTIAMADEAYLGIGDGISGFDVYAKQGGTAYVDRNHDYDFDDVDESWIIADHDAYGAPGPWGTWFDPDCADWDKYSLELTDSHWYLRYTSTGESPMSGNLVWTSYNPYGTSVGYAYETDAGTTLGGSYVGGGAGNWDWGCGWGAEVIPLEYATFRVVVNSPGVIHTVSLTPVPVPGPGTVLLGGLGVGLVGWLRRRRTL